MKRLFFIVLAAACMACTEYLPYRDDNQGNNNANTPTSDLLCAAVVFPPGCNWHSGGADTCSHSICFFKGDAVLARIEEADGYGDGADNHRICGSHLYHFICEDGCCRMSMDNSELFAYTGNEDLCDMLLHDGILHTLTSIKGEQGWAYRQNGILKIVSRSGKLMGGLYTDNSKVCFSFAEEVTLAGSDKTELKYYSVEDGHQTQLIPCMTGMDMKAIRKDGDKLHYMASVIPQKYMTWSWDQTLAWVDKTAQADEYRNVYMFKAGENLMAHYYVVYNKTGAANGYGKIWGGQSGDVFTTSAGYEIRSCTFNNGNLGICCSPYGRNRGIELYLNGRHSILPSNLVMTSESAITHDGKRFHIGLNDADDGYRPLIISGKDTLRYDFNGYFTYIALP